MHTARLYPSLFHSTRTRTCPPPLREQWPFAQCPNIPERAQWAAAPQMYHPLVRAFAAPGCTARAIRLPLAVATQWQVDILAGAAALGAAILCAMVGRTQMAGALLQEHALHIIIAALTVGAILATGAMAGAAVHLMRLAGL